MPFDNTPKMFRPEHLRHSPENPHSVQHGGTTETAAPPPVSVVVDPDGNDAGNEIQLVTVDAASGVFRLTFAGKTTVDLPYNDSAANVQIALEDLSSIGVGNIGVTGNAGGPYTVEFKGIFADAPQSLLIADSTSLVSANAVQQVAINSNKGTFTVTFNGDTTTTLSPNLSAEQFIGALQNLHSIGQGNIDVTIPEPNVYDLEFIGTLGNKAQSLMTVDSSQLIAENEIQTVAFADYPSLVGSGGTFTVTFNGQTTGALAYNISPANLQTAMQGLSSIGAGNILVYQDPDQAVGVYYWFEFVGTLMRATQPLCSINTSGLLNAPSINQIVLHNTVGGTFTLTFLGSTTGNIAYNASAATVQTALENLVSIGIGNVTVNAVTVGSLPGYTFSLPTPLFDRSSVFTFSAAGLVGANRKDNFTITGATGGTFQIAFENGPGSRNTSTALAYNTDSTTVQAALQAMPLLGTGNILVTDPPGGPFVSEMVGALASQDVFGSFIMIGAGLTGPNPWVYTSEAVQGGPGWIAGAGPPYGNVSNRLQNGFVPTMAFTVVHHGVTGISTVSSVTTGHSGTAIVTRVHAGSTGDNCVQKITALVAQGNFKLASPLSFTAPISITESSASEIQELLEDLEDIGVGNVTVTGPRTGPWTVTFVGSLAAQSMFTLVPLRA